MSKFSRLTGAVRTRKVSSGMLTAMVVLAVLVANIALYFVASAFGWYFYKAEALDLSLSYATDDYFKDAIEQAKEDSAAGLATEKVKISFCMAKEDIEQHDPGKYVHETAVRLAERHPEIIEVEYVNIYTQTNSKGETVPLSKYAKVVSGGEEVSVPLLTSSVIFSYNNLGVESYKVVTDYVTSSGFSSFFTLSADLSVSSYNGEEVISALVCWVMKAEHPTAFLTTGHDESSSTSFTTMLTCAGYNIELLNLRGMSGEDELRLLSNDDNVVIISNPSTDFGRASGNIRDEIERLETYIAGGGNLYVSLDPYVKTEQMLNLNRFLSEYGISLSTHKNEEGTVLNNIINDSSEGLPASGYSLVASYADNQQASAMKAIAEKYGSGKVLVREAAALNCGIGEKGKAAPVLISSQGSVCEAGGKVTDTAGGYCIAASSVASNGEGDDGAIFVIASPYFAANDAVINDGYSNKDFIYSVINLVFGADAPPYGCAPVIYDTSRLEGLTSSSAGIYTALILLIPTVIAAVGAVTIIRRKRR